MYSFPNLNQYIVPCLVLTGVSWAAFRFHKRPVRWSVIPISLRIVHSLLWYTQSKPLNLISGSSAFSKSSLYVWKFLAHVLMKPLLEDFELYFASMWKECNCGVVWSFLVIIFLWDWNENWPFPVLWLLLSFPDFLAILSATLSQHHLWGFEIAQLEFHQLHQLFHSDDS